MYIGASTLAPPMARPPTSRDADEEAGRAGQAGGDGAGEEQSAVEQHRRPPAMTVGDCPRDECAHCAAEQHGRDGKARGGRPGPEGVPQRVDRPVDDATVEAEEKPADGGHRAQGDDVGQSWTVASAAPIRCLPCQARLTRAGSLTGMFLVRQRVCVVRS